MSETMRRESPLIAFDLPARAVATPAASEVQAAERPFLGQLNLRGDAKNTAFLDAVAAALGTPPPLEANTAVQNDDLTVFWLGPDEWLVVTPPQREAEVASALRQALKNLFTAVTEVSSGQTVIRIGGPKARELLAMGCSLDLHPRVFGPGRCAQTLVARIGVLIHQVDVVPTFDLYVRRSFADFFWRWLEDAGAELKMVVMDGGV